MFIGAPPLPGAADARAANSYARSLLSHRQSKSRQETLSPRDRPVGDFGRASLVGTDDSRFFGAAETLRVHQFAGFGQLLVKALHERDVRLDVVHRPGPDPRVFHPARGACIISMYFTAELLVSLWTARRPCASGSSAVIGALMSKSEQADDSRRVRG